MPDPGQIPASFLTSICIPYGQGYGMVGEETTGEQEYNIGGLP